MRTKNISLLVVLILILIVLAIFPWADGLLFKRQYYQFFQALQADNQVKITIVEYQAGWFSSNAKVIIEPIMPNSKISSPTLSEMGYTTPTIILKQTIKHGPFVYDPINNHLTLALASIRSNVLLPAFVEAILLGGQPNTNGIVTINSLATFGNDFLNQIKTPIFNIPIPPVNTNVTWNGINGLVNFHLSGSNIKTIKAKITLGALTARNNAGSLVTKDAFILNNLEADPSSLWNGSYAFNAPEVTFTDSKQIFSIKNFSINSSFGVVAPNLYSSSIEVALGELSTPYFSANQSRLHASLDNLKADALLNLANTFQSETKPADPDQQISMLLALLSPSTIYKEEINVNTSYGKLISQGEATLPVEVKTIGDIKTNVKAKVDIRLSIPLANQLIELFNPPLPSAPQSVAVNVNTPEEALLKQIDQWSNNGTIDLSIGIQIKEVVKMHLEPADFARNIDRFVKLNQLNEGVATQLKNQYTLLQTANKTTVTASAPAPMPLTRSDEIKQKLAELVKLGYIKQDQNDYVTTLIFEQGVLKANGIEVKDIIP